MIEQETVERLQKAVDNLTLTQNHILAKLNALGTPQTETEQKEHILLDTFHERAFYQDFRTDWNQNPELKDLFLELVKGLDEESIRTVVRSIKRLRKIRGTNERYLALYSKEEEREYALGQEALQQEVIRLSKDCYYYHGYMLPRDSFEACVFQDRCGMNELEYPQAFADMDIIDAGAFIGDSTLLFAPLTSGRVYAFEPTTNSFENLQMTISMNELTNVVPCKMALGMEEGTVEMALSPFSPSNTQVRNRGMIYTGKETVEVTTLDDFVKKNKLNVGLIKVDVEGAEQMLLRGALDTIRSMKPTLLVSIYHSEDDYFRIKPFLESLDLGYRFKIRHPAVGTVLADTMLIAEIPHEN